MDTGRGKKPRCFCLWNMCEWSFDVLNLYLCIFYFARRLFINLFIWQLEPIADGWVVGEGMVEGWGWRGVMQSSWHLWSVEIKNGGLFDWMIMAGWGGFIVVLCVFGGGEHLALLWMACNQIIHHIWFCFTFHIVCMPPRQRTSRFPLFPHPLVFHA